jgi:hypothetical protein
MNQRLPDFVLAGQADEQVVSHAVEHAPHGA